jgi:hypothetical protein
LSTTATVSVSSSGELIGTTEFNVALADHNITIPALVRDKVAKEAKVKVKAKYLLKSK